ncbi:hypothetical protein OIU77_010544 [Salix suchowensis]|uniref:Cyanobacterial aminoacyl-tRNA synthetase CAAD domain-containing protein n=1 Tax=Salix suchowensis TaxID=1278906 RepID=A0ABQ9A8Q6_9ROSI|nr:hypothetical protein OIU77_010544 [Salix suchowensis]
MASASSTPLSISSSSSLVDAKASRQSAVASPQCVSLPTLPPPPVHPQNRPWKAAAYCRKIARNSKKLGIKVEDKYAVSSLAVAGGVALWGSAGLISAIDRLPLIPGVFEIVGIGYTGWFAYKNLVFKPDREALIAKIKDTYKEVIGSS